MNPSMNQIPKISVIVPVYNTDSYLQICLESIAKQTYSNFEVILVDDGSTDNSAEICKKFVESDSRFHYFYKKNEGQATARNFGLKRVKGDFISFIDSDDFIHQDYLNVMIGTIEREQADVAVCQFLLWFTPYCLDPTINSEIKKPDVSTENEKAFRYGIFSLVNSSKSPIIFGGHVANKIFRSQVLQGIYFKNWKVEDEIFLFEVTRNIKKIAYVWEKMYLYRQHPSSSINAKGFNRAILETREHLLTQCKTSSEKSCVRQAILLQVYRIATAFLYLDSDSETISFSDLKFVHQTAKKAFIHFSYSELSATITRTRLFYLRLFVLCPISCLKVIFFISRKICFLPFFYKTIKKLTRILN